MINIKKFKIIFAGSTNISAIHLEFLVQTIQKLEILAVFTNNLSKKQKLNPVEKICKRYNLIVYNQNLNNAISLINNLKPQLIIVIAYGKILSNKILSIPTFGGINVHFSNLPRWIGAAPIQRAIIANDKITGISIIKMNSKLDHGKILFNSNYCIEKSDNTITLTNQLNNLSKKGLLIILNKLLNKEPIFSVHQNFNNITYARKISKEETKLKWWYPSFYLVRYIKALIPDHTTYFQYKNIYIKVWEANALNIYEVNNTIPGQIILVDVNGIQIATGLGILNITKIQLPGKRPIHISSFLNSSKNRNLFTINDIIA